MTTRTEHPVGTTERCAGCGAEFESQTGPTHRYMLSAPGCWARYGEVLAQLSTTRAAEAPLVMCVDAYAVQHPGVPNPQAIQSIAVHLINLHSYLVLGRAVSSPRVVGHKGRFHWLTPPPVPATLTVLSVPLTGSLADLTAGAHAWASAAWAAWAPHHAQVASWAAEYGRP